MNAKWFGFNPPFVDGNNILPFQTDERLIKNDLMQLLMTSPGERVMRADFGTDIRKYVFEQMTPQSINALRDNIITAINKYETRVKLSNVKITANPEGNLATISILASIIAANPIPIELVLSF